MANGLISVDGQWLDFQFIRKYYERDSLFGGYKCLSGSNHAKPSEPPQIGGPAPLEPAASLNQHNQIRRPTTGPTPLEPTVSLKLHKKAKVSREFDKSKTNRVSIKVFTCKKFIALGHPVTQLYPRAFSQVLFLCCQNHLQSPHPPLHNYNSIHKNCLILVGDTDRIKQHLFFFKPKITL